MLTPRVFGMSTGSEIKSMPGSEFDLALVSVVQRVPWCQKATPLHSLPIPLHFSVAALIIFYILLTLASILKAHAYYLSLPIKSSLKPKKLQSVSKKQPGFAHLLNAAQRVLLSVLMASGKALLGGTEFQHHGTGWQQQFLAGPAGTNRYIRGE